MNLLSEIAFTRFRNYDFQKFNFHKKIVGIYGENGSGKTNLLDGIYYLCFTKSYFSRPDARSVRQGYEGFRIEGVMQDGSRVACVYRETGKKEFYAGQEQYKKFSAHLGKYPCVMIAPDDVQLVTGTSEERRRFTDTILSQCDAGYLQQLIRYNKVLQQRNSLLKNSADAGFTDDSLLEIFDAQLADAGEKIYSKRAVFFSEIIPEAIKQYNTIADRDDNMSVSYHSQLHTDKRFAELLRESRSKDLLLQRTNTGIHKDDILFLMDGDQFKNIASQGQRKSLLFAMRLAEFFYLKGKMPNTPILLLDDVFEKLDENRMGNLLELICLHAHTQVFITDTHQHRLSAALTALAADFELIGL